MKNIDILSISSNKILLDKTKEDLKNIMNIEVGEKSMFEVLEEMREKWDALEPSDKEIISQNIAGIYYSPKFRDAIEV